MIPFKVYNPLPPHTALPLPSFVKTALVVVKLPPVTLNVFVTSDVVVKVPLSVAPIAFKFPLSVAPDALKVPLVTTLVTAVLPNCIVLSALTIA